MGGLPNIAKTLALPHENRPVRLPTYPNLERTALVSVEYNATTSSATYSRDHRRYMLCRDAGAPFWIDTRYDDADPANTKPPPVAYATDVFPELTPQDDTVANWTSATPLAPFGLEDEQPVWAWVPRGADGPGISFQLAASVVGGQLDAEMTILHPTGGLTSFHQVGIGYTTPKDFPYTDVWVKIETVKVTSSVSTALVLASFTGTRRYLMPAFAPLESTVSTAPYDSCRLNAVSLLMTNVSRVQIKQGTVLAGRLQRTNLKPWSWYESDISNVHPADRYFGSAEVGAYTYVAPGQETSKFRQAGATVGLITQFRVNDTPLVVSGTQFSPTMHVNDDEYFHAIVVSEETGVDETILAITVDLHVEFRSSSSLFMLGISALPLESYHATLLALNQTGYFFENHTHWRELASLLVRGINAALPVVAPQLVGPVRALSSAAVVGYKAGRAIISSMKRKPRNMTQKQMVVPQRQRRSRPRARKTNRRGRGKRRN